jgi:NAD(P)-dependent dehydrogenase (short-subunit alcohol dehydrogenase family)
MKIEGSVALVSGANRGLGRALARALVAGGAATVYGAARDPGAVTEPGVTPVRLDITDLESVARLARQLPDVSLLVNNAATSRGGALLTESMEEVRGDFETNFFGTLAVSRAFAPILAANGGGAVVNILSVLSFVNVTIHAAYSAAKSAEWSLTNALRLELREQGTQVVGVHVGYMDTDMAAHIDAPKQDPAAVAATVLEGLADGRHEVLVDELSRQVKAGLSADLGALYPTVA